jgi:hypothetical protein
MLQKSNSDESEILIVMSQFNSFLNSSRTEEFKKFNQ